jgi:hypothetical protein
MIARNVTRTALMVEKKLIKNILTENDNFSLTNHIRTYVTYHENSHEPINIHQVHLNVDTEMTLTPHPPILKSISALIPCNKERSLTNIVTLALLQHDETSFCFSLSISLGYIVQISFCISLLSLAYATVLSPI